jgi:hypothetical protein
MTAEFCLRCHQVRELVPGQVVCHECNVKPPQIAQLEIRSQVEAQRQEKARLQDTRQQLDQIQIENSNLKERIRQIEEAERQEEKRSIRIKRMYVNETKRRCQREIQLIKEALHD